MEVQVEACEDVRLLCVVEDVWLRLSGALLLLLPRHTSGKTEKNAVRARIENRGILSRRMSRHKVRKEKG